MRQENLKFELSLSNQARGGRDGIDRRKHCLLERPEGIKEMEAERGQRYPGMTYGSTAPKGAMFTVL